MLYLQIQMLFQSRNGVTNQAEYT